MPIRFTVTISDPEPATRGHPGMECHIRLCDIEGVEMPEGTPHIADRARGLTLEETRHDIPERIAQSVGLLLARQAEAAPAR